MNKPAIGILLRGGLGNQMFQYAFGLSMSIKHNLPLLLDTRELAEPIDEGRVVQDSVMRSFSLKHFPISNTGSASPIFDIQYKLLTESQIRLDRLWPFVRTNTILSETKFTFNKISSSRVKNGVYLVGYWQSYKYFDSIADRIKDEYDIKQDDLPERTRHLAKEIQDSGGICLNIRRADFATHKASRDFHGCLDLEYYQSALEELYLIIGKSRVFLFSDDLTWSKKHFGNASEIQIVDHSYAGPSFVHYLSLMRQCRGFVIPNSTFGWWAAWLAVGNRANVVAPIRWFQNKRIDTSDLIPPTWIRV